ncbi:hypothetical protein LCGC14_1301610 [marine sediment metagenome]|uniref:Uncharacterized protein n=1 Tax=marine sediment metagenome TaxID=412755 RepID=A0A0F9KPR7_9ZZZZ
MTDINITAKNVTSCRERIAEYEAKALTYEDMAARCVGRQRAAYRRSSKQAMKNRDRMLDNLTFQLNWLRVNRPSVYDEVK